MQDRRETQQGQFRHDDTRGNNTDNGNMGIGITNVKQETETNTMTPTIGTKTWNMGT